MEKDQVIYEQGKCICIRDLITYLLRKWKVILAGAVILAVVCGGYSWVRGNRGSSVTAPGSSLSESEKKAAMENGRMLEEYETVYEEYSQYLEESIVARLNPNGYYQGSLRYLIKGESYGEAMELLLSCKDYLLGIEQLQRMSDQLEGNPNPAYLNEVIFVEEGSKTEHEFVDTEGQQIVSVSTNTGEEQILTITVCYDDQEECEKILKICEKMTAENFSKEPENASKVRKISSEVTMKCDRKILALSRNIALEQQKLQTYIEEIEGVYTSDQKAYYESTKAETTEEGETAVLEPQKSGISKKWVVLGGFLGAFFTAAAYGAVYLLDGRLHTKAELESVVKVPVLAYAEKKEGSLEVLAVQIETWAKQRKTDRLFLTGSVEMPEQEKNLEKILKKKGIQVIPGKSILKDSEALAQAVACGYIAFLEKEGTSKTDLVKAQLVQAQSCDLEILGVLWNIERV